MGYRWSSSDFRFDINWLVPGLLSLIGVIGFGFALDLLNNPHSRQQFLARHPGLKPAQLEEAIVGQAWRYGGFGLLFLALGVGAWFLFCRGQEDLT